MGKKHHDVRVRLLLLYKVSGIRFVVALQRLLSDALKRYYEQITKINGGDASSPPPNISTTI
jgi:hypothetical protein